VRRGPSPRRRAVVFTIGTQDNPGNYEDAIIAAIDLTSSDAKIVTLIEGGSIARYSPSGHLLYSRGGEVLAVPFDPDRLEVTGPPETVLEGVGGELPSGVVDFAIARNGTLIYRPAGTSVTEREYVWVDRDGRIETVTRAGRQTGVMQISPDGKRVVVTTGLGPGDGELFVYDFARDSMTRLTFDGSRIGGTWSLDGKRILHGVTRGGSEGLYSISADGGGTERMILRDGGEYVSFPEAFVPLSDELIFVRSGGLGGYSLLTLVPGEDTPRPLLVTAFAEAGTTLSPDGKWMAYSSDESGRLEVYVRPFPGPGGKWQLSKDGGKGAAWSRDGREIFYTHGDRMMVVPVEIEQGFSASAPRMLFQLDFDRTTSPQRDYDVSPDGKRFFMSRRPADESVQRRIDVIAHFAETLGD